MLCNVYNTTKLNLKGKTDMLNIDASWKEIENFSNLNLILDEILALKSSGKTIYPDDVFAAFNKTPLDKVKAVILGQDPYHNPNEANGLAFSVNEGIKFPPSLRNIFKELESNLGIVRTNSDLSDWAEQGVLLLNTALTVEKNSPNCHKALWQDFTDNVIKLLNEQKKSIIFVLWGGNAQSKKCFITNPMHSIIESAHPSPLSAYRGFFNSKPFSKINDILTKNNQEPIKW